jgi:hypothetical protein
MEGGAPEGIKMRPGEDGCLTKRKRIRVTTMQGNSRTKPSGIEIDELPFIRIRRRKNDNRGKPRPLSVLKSFRDGMLGAEGIRLTSPCTKPIAETSSPVEFHATCRGALPAKQRWKGYQVLRRQSKRERCLLGIATGRRREDLWK